MITYDAAQAVIAAAALPLGKETVPLAKAGRRTLACDIYARIDAPRCDVSAMDGFAIAGPVDVGSIFSVIGASFPGNPFPGKIAVGQAVRITTGGQAPRGTDRVLPIEITRSLAPQARIEVVKDPSTRSHVRLRGSDFRAGDRLLGRGTSIDPRVLIVAAAGDLATVPVHRRPRSMILTIGDELGPAGTALGKDHLVPDSLSDALLLFCRQWGAVPVGSLRLRDDPDALQKQVQAISDGLDVLVICGGASRGERDYARPALAASGIDEAFAGVAIKPGKPVWYGHLGGCHVLGLPGNPTAALTTARLFLACLLAGLSGNDPLSALAWFQAPLSGNAPPGGDREQFLCGWWDGREVEILERQEASAQLMLARANVLVRRPAGATAISHGTSVSVLRF